MRRNYQSRYWTIQTFKVSERWHFSKGQAWIELKRSEKNTLLYILLLPNNLNIYKESLSHKILGILPFQASIVLLEIMGICKWRLMFNLKSSFFVQSFAVKDSIVGHCLDLIIEVCRLVILLAKTIKIEFKTCLNIICITLKGN